MRRNTFLVVIVGLLLGAGSAGAQDAQILKKIDTLNRLAMEEYDLGEYPAALKGLEKTLEAIKAAKLETHAIAAVTRVNLGIVHGGGLMAADAAVREFVTALEIDPTVTLPADRRTAELDKLFDQARAAIEARKKPPEAAPDGPVKGIAHTPVDAAPEGQAIAIAARVGADVKAKKVILYYRARGAKDWIVVAMAGSLRAGYRAEIPPGATATDAIEYYIEARNAKAKIAATRGNAATPFSITIARVKPPEAEDDELDDENPLEP